MTLKSKIFIGLILCASFNSQAFANDNLMKIRDLQVGIVTSEKVITNFKEKSVSLEFTISQLKNMRSILKQNPDGMVLFDQTEENINYQNCPSVDIDAHRIKISTNWLGIPKYYKLSDVSDDYIDKITQARCAVIPIETARIMYGRAKKILFPENNLNR